MLGGEIIATGYIQVQVSVGNQARAIAQAMVRIYKITNEVIAYDDYFMTNDEGKTESIPLLTPDRSLSLSANNEQQPYETYNVQVRANGYEMEEVHGVQIFAGEHSVLHVEPIPSLSTTNTNRNVSVIPHHQLYGGEMRSNVGQGAQSVMAAAVNHKQSRILQQVIIPNNITVHLGRPDSNAENLTVPFLYYLKNVASSEIYPTWPYEALKANIWAQMSLALNRVYTEWYPSRGYAFNITNSTAFDQAFVKNRNIYDSVANIVDEVYGEYIQKRNFVEPYYAEYCDGRMVSCPGMKQWGTVDLANRGMSAFEILQYYYGDEINIVSSNNFQDIKSSYPGTPLRVGSTGSDVALIQEQLNAIAINYPSIPPVFPVNGVFGTSTEDAVKVFQRQFNLAPDGIVGQATWYKMSYIYVAVRKLAELTSLGRISGLYSGAWPGTVLREGSRGVEVQLLQYYLSTISLFYKDIPPVSIDGRFGPAMERSVIAFQRYFGLVQDGIVGQTTWDKIFEVYTSVENEVIPPSEIPPYPGTPIRFGDRGENVRLIQNALNTVATQYPSVPIVGVDGVFGNATLLSVTAFQNQFNLPGDGIVGQNTWNTLFQAANEIEQGGSAQVSTTPAFAGTTLQEGSDGDSVILAQERLRTIHQYYPSIPEVQTTGNFDLSTKQALRAFQHMLGIPANAKLDKQTWNLINQTYHELQALS